MPVTTSYPGVYIEEVPSAVKTISGVATSVGAFVGYATSGPVHSAQQIFSFGEYERVFGGLSRDSPMSYAVKHFFDNGGGTAWVVRATKGALKASVRLRRTATDDAFKVAAVTEGAWGNDIRVTVDRAGLTNQFDLFNLVVEEVVSREGADVTTRSETFTVSMDPESPVYAPDVVESGSAMIRLSNLPPNSAVTGAGTSASGTLTEADVDGIVAGVKDTIAITINGDGPYNVTLTKPAGADLAAKLTALRAELESKIRALRSTPAFMNATVAAASGVITVTSGATGVSSSVRITEAPTAGAARQLKLGAANGGTERPAAGVLRPLPNGTWFTAPPTLTGLTANGRIGVAIGRGASAAAAPLDVTLWTTAPTLATPEAARQLVENALHARSEPELRDATVRLLENRLLIIPGGADDTRLEFAKVDPADADTRGAQLFGDLTQEIANVRRYRLGLGPAITSQVAPSPGTDGDPPDDAAIIGSLAAKTGVFALEEVDLFNLLVIPGASSAVYAAAIPYIAERRAFMVIDVPKTIATPQLAASWPADKGLVHPNTAAYWPWIELPDPLRGNRLTAYPPSGAVAGIYARTDATRGVWKAPAGTEATLFGVQRLTAFLTDPESGVLNDKAVNALRAFPTFGRVVWGARTTKGAKDEAVTEWRYVPVRRTALFLEESLYRGLQWVVFEPNDEPLWAQIRLNVGAFMHNLFRQGAFQGASPRDAYLVKCDAETTTQSDINLGVVNVLVGFAPLKPAEFVILKISQLAGQIQV